MESETREIGFVDEIGPIHGQRVLSEQEVDYERQNNIVEGATNLICRITQTTDLNLGLHQQGIALERIYSTLDELSDKQRQIIEQAFGLLGDNPLTTNEIQRKYARGNWSGEAIIGNVIRELRHPSKLGRINQDLGIELK